MTINAEGVYWHPLSTDPDLLVTREVFPLAKAAEKISQELETISVAPNAGMQEFQ